MDFKKVFGGFLGYFVFAFFVLLLVFISIPGNLSIPVAQVFGGSSWNLVFTIFIAVLVWLISPIGVLSVMFGALGARKYSALKNKIVALSEFFSMLSWLSAMIIMMLVYADDAYYKILHLGSDLLYLGLVSGFIFGFLIILKSAWRKSLRKNYYRSDDFWERKIAGNCCEYSGEGSGSFSGIKDKIKYRVKREIKDIINEEIDRRF